MNMERKLIVQSHCQDMEMKYGFNYFQKLTMATKRFRASQG